MASGQNSYVAPSQKLPSHPRLLMMKGEEKSLKKAIMKDAEWQNVNNAILDEADQIIGLPLNERIKEGKRLLAVSRENLRRIFVLSYAYRMTGKKDYLKRAESEMLKAASFSDWNPSHFLDVGEMTMALAIGYDWLYDKLSPETRKTIESAIIEKGLKPSYDKHYNWFVNAVNNWNQVCNAGVSYGALAIWEKDPELCSSIVNRAIEKIALPMEHYAPDGAYPEGGGYWEYGTSFCVMFLSAIEKAFGTDFGLSQKPGFLKTGEYILNIVTPNLNLFSYSDNGSRAFLSPAMFWFYDKTKDPSILYNQIRLYQRDGTRRIRKDRLAPAMVIWGASASLSNPVKPSRLYWKASGDNPVCFMRTAWDDTSAIFTGMKMGSPSVNHAHMDVGSFIMEADGVRWAIDMGGENYYRLESRGVDLWNMNQDSQRWDVFRYNNFAHNTLTFNHKLQKVDGKAEITGYSDSENDMYVISDLTPVYKGQVKSAKRAVSLINKEYVVVEDKIETSNRYTMATWTLVTPANAKVISNDVLLLEKDGKKLYVKVSGPESIRWHISPAVSPFSFDSPNPGVSIVGFDTDLKRSATQNIVVRLIPEENKDVRYESVIE
jgi:hypothetical protein